MRTHLWMAAGLVAGLVLGLAASLSHSPALLWVTGALRPIGDLFLNLLQVAVIPLIVAALFGGIAGLGDIRQLGVLGRRALTFFLGTQLLAVLLGLVLGWWLLPLAPVTSEHQAALQLARDTTLAHPRSLPSGADVIVNLVPTNPFKAAVDGTLLPLVVFVVIFGFAASALPAEQRRLLTDLADVVTQALSRIMRWVLYFAPIGILGVVAPAVAKFGISLIASMAWFYILVTLGVASLIGVYAAAAWWFGGVRVWHFLRAVTPTYLMGFSTTTSIATLPTMFATAERDLQLPTRVSGVVLPLGASMHRGGSAVFQALAVLFAARLFGVPIGVADLVPIALAVYFASLTVGPIPHASIVSLTPVFNTAGVPLAGLSLLLGLDRIPDMIRTGANVTGQLTGAIVAAGRPERRA